MWHHPVQYGLISIKGGPHVDLPANYCRCTHWFLVIWPRLLGRCPLNQFCVVEPKPNLASKLDCDWLCDHLCDCFVKFWWTSLSPLSTASLPWMTFRPGTIPKSPLMWQQQIWWCSKTKRGDNWQNTSMSKPYCSRCCIGRISCAHHLPGKCHTNFICCRSLLLLLLIPLI